MSDYWLSTLSPKDMHKASYQTPQLDAYIIETQGVDPSLLSAETGLPRHHVMAYQRRLGVRQFTGNGVARND